MAPTLSPKNPKAMEGATKTVARKGKREKKEYTCEKCVYKTNENSNMRKHIRGETSKTCTIDIPGLTSVL